MKTDAPIQTQRNLSSLELLLMGLEQPAVTETVALRRGSDCPQCGQSPLDYNGLLQLQCPACGFASAEGAGCT